MKRFGKLGLARTLERAIHLARKGFKATPLLIRRIRHRQRTLKGFAEARRLFLPRGQG